MKYSEEFAKVVDSSLAAWKDCCPGQSSADFQLVLKAAMKRERLYVGKSKSKSTIVNAG